MGSLVVHVLCKGLIYKIVKMVEASLVLVWTLHALQLNQDITKQVFINGCGIVTHDGALKSWLWISFDNIYLIVKALLRICYH